VPSSQPQVRFLDILENIRLIQSYVAGMDRTAFEADSRTRDAVERCLERISEAATKLGPTAEMLAPGPLWPDVRGLGNVLRHAYDKIDSAKIWKIISTDIPAMSAAAEAALQRLEQPQAPHP